MTEPVSAHIRVKGRVQGVGFRWFTQQTAQQLGLTGNVRNLYSGEVEINVEGDKATIMRLIDTVKVGTSLAGVEGVDVQWGAYRGQYPQFSIEF
ncbi:MAG: acylphosphatase [Gemmatimonadetes bacterium]|nr:MAG: acylphosphatase [Gemmatimonadota bacterium]